MINKWLSWLNYFLISLVALVMVATGFVWLKRPAEIVSTQPLSQKGGLPKSSFELPPEAYENISGQLLALEQTPPSLQIPDLRQQLVYYGKNGRPDGHSEHTMMHFSVTSNPKTVVSIGPEEKLYLVYDRSNSQGRYAFSPNNEESSLWIETIPVDNEVLINVRFVNDKGERVVEPESNAQFRLQEKEFIRMAGASWDLGANRVDGTLLARQKARWYGPDRFLEHHGGNDFSQASGKQRIDFGETDNLYTVFVKVGDSLIWDEEQWKSVEPGPSSIGKPMMVVKKVDERIMTFELWDVEGKGKILLNLLKSSEPWTVQNAQVLQPMFKFVGAKTRSQCVFEINKQRMVLSPSDWLLLTPKGWIKIEKSDEIDDYVKGKLKGTLFVFEGLSRKDDRQIMKGTIYSPARHDFSEVEIALQTGGAKPSANKDAKDKDAKDAKNKDSKEVVEMVGEVPAPMNRYEQNRQIPPPQPLPNTAQNPGTNPPTKR